MDDKNRFDNLRYKTQKEITFERMQKYNKTMEKEDKIYIVESHTIVGDKANKETDWDKYGKKSIYPNVKVETVMLKGGRGYYIEDTWKLTLETYLRKKHRGKYYLEKHWREFSFPAGKLNTDSIVENVNHFHAGIYKSMLLGRVDLKLVIGHYDPPKPVFELDPDQTDERARLIPKI